MDQNQEVQLSSKVKTRHYLLPISTQQSLPKEQVLDLFIFNEFER